MNSLFSPEALIMLPLAALLDIIGIICFIANVFFGIGEILSFIPDILGMVLIGAWITFRSMTKSITKEEAKQQKQELVIKTKERIKTRKEMRMKRKMSKLKGVKIGRFGKFGLAFIGELIPFLGVLPFWTIQVYAELKSDE